MTFAGVAAENEHLLMLRILLAAHTLRLFPACMQHGNQARTIVTLNQDKRQISQQHIQNVHNRATPAGPDPEKPHAAQAQKNVNELRHAGFADHAHDLRVAGSALYALGRHEPGYDSTHIRNDGLPAIDLDFKIQFSSVLHPPGSVRKHIGAEQALWQYPSQQKGCQSCQRDVQ